MDEIMETEELVKDKILKYEGPDRVWHHWYKTRLLFEGSKALSMAKGYKFDNFSIDHLMRISFEAIGITPRDVVEKIFHYNFGDIGSILGAFKKEWVENFQENDLMVHVKRYSSGCDPSGKILLSVCPIISGQFLDKIEGKRAEDIVDIFIDRIFAGLSVCDNDCDFRTFNHQLAIVYRFMIVEESKKIARYRIQQKKIERDNPEPEAEK